MHETNKFTKKKGLHGKVCTEPQIPNACLRCIPNTLGWHSYFKVNSLGATKIVISHKHGVITVILTMV